MNYGVNVGTYTLMLLQGAELGREDEIKKYGLKSAWRIVPRDFGTYRGKKLNPQVLDFYLELKCFGNKQLFKKGNITLIR